MGSGQDENECFFQIKSEQNGQFTHLVHELALSAIPCQDIELRVDGPYGAPFVYEGYERIILIGGGIGITPCHSIFRTLLAQSICGDELLPSVDLIWVARDNQMFSLFTSTWQLFEEHNSDNDKHSFSLRLFATRKENENEKKDDSEFNNVVADTQALMYTHGRPDWSNVLKIIVDDQNNANKTLVFVCGPQGMVD